MFKSNFYSYYQNVELLVTGSLSNILSGRGSAPFFSGPLNPVYFKKVSKEFGDDLELSLIDMLNPHFEKVSYLTADIIKKSLLDILYNNFITCNIISLDPILLCKDDLLIRKSKTDKTYLKFFELDCSVTSPIDDDFLFISEISGNNHLVPRWGSRLKKNGISNMLINIQQTRKKTDIILVDEVIFSGETICRVREKFLKFGMDVSAVVSGIADLRGKYFLEAQGIQVFSSFLYDSTDRNWDTIEARDFFIVPQGGRAAYIRGNLVRIPRFSPASRLDKRFNVNFDKGIELSSRLIDLNIDLYKYIQRCSAIDIAAVDLPETFFSINSSRLASRRTVRGVLQQIKSKLNNPGIG
jgi:hypothetical protein